MQNFPKISLFIGGASSGKSRQAERFVRQSGMAPVYLATAEPFDDEMTAKIASHRARRDATWRLIEEPIDLHQGFETLRTGEILLIDCLTMWLTNLMLAKLDIDREAAHLTRALSSANVPVVMVTNDVGAGGIAENALARRFQIEQGRLNQKVAESADLVVSVTAGLPLVLKGCLPETGS